ncbi:hypothetical protein V496_10408 [Pseudogymnoascus sp. VKM F-4515 (FW-2607)]|nr:hypothetical protein V496_10408 [Pseudogymnoascus sp. VKM F-4515 (FW-2607)]KFY76824.1 hypothetical protein V498_09495 [Pseudogymnoascus sp. VKM F-4517 (FW-2822)]
MVNNKKRILLKVLKFLLLVATDISFNVAAGAAAVAVGAYVNGSPLTQLALRAGMKAAATKSGSYAFIVLIRFANLNIAAYMLLIIVSSMFGLAVLVTAQVSDMVLGEVATPLLVAALVATLPLRGVVEVETYNFRPRLCSLFQGYLKMIVSYASSGFVFALVAHCMGMNICAFMAAAAAGAIYGAVSGISTTINFLYSVRLLRPPDENEDIV